MSGRHVLAFITICAALAGCGGSEDDAPVEALEQFLTAVEEGDEAKACGLLSTPYVEFIETAEGAPCEESLDVSPNAEVVKEIKAGRYELTRDRGRVIVRPKNGLGGYELEREEGKWRVVSPG